MKFLVLLFLLFPSVLFSQDSIEKIEFAPPLPRSLTIKLKEDRNNAPDIITYLEYTKKQLLGMKSSLVPDFKNNEERDQYVMKLIAKIPQEKLPYYAPALFENSAISRSILDQPLLKQYEGKLPEVIAPEVQDIVDKYGKHISPDLYPLLMPEIYEPFRPKEKSKIEVEDKETPKEAPEFVITVKIGEKLPQPKNNALNHSMALDLNDPFITGELSKERNEKITPKTKLTNQDVLDFISTIPDVRAVVESEEGIKAMTPILDKIEDDSKNSCVRFIKRFKKAELTDKIAETVKKHKFDLESWENICVRTFNASDYMSLDLGKVAMYQAHLNVSEAMGRPKPKASIDADDFKALHPYANLFYYSLAKDKFIIGSKN